MALSAEPEVTPLCTLSPSFFVCAGWWFALAQPGGTKSKKLSKILCGLGQECSYSLQLVALFWKVVKTSGGRI